MSGYAETAPFTERLPSCIASIYLLLHHHCARESRPSQRRWSR